MTHMHARSLRAAIAAKLVQTWQWQTLQHEPHERPYLTTFMLVLGRVVYLVTLACWTYLFFLAYSDIFSQSHSRLSQVPLGNRAYFHAALILALAVALLLGRPRPNPWAHLQPPIAVPVYVLRVLAGLHSARILLYALWLACGYCCLWFTQIANPAAFGVAVGCLVLMFWSMFRGLAKRFVKPLPPETVGEPSIVWREDLGPQRSNSPMTIAQLPDRIAAVWAMNEAALRGRK